MKLPAKRDLASRTIDRLEDLAILILAVLAFFLIGKTGLFQTVVASDESQTGTTITLSQDVSLSQDSPVALLIQNSQGRYGVQYDQETVDTLYSGGLEDFLLQALGAMDQVKSISEDTWQKTMTQGEAWVLYDFLCPASFTYSDGQGEGRLFLVSVRTGRIDALCYYDEAADTYYSGRVKDINLDLPDRVKTLADNGATLAFEGDYDDLLSPNLLLTREAPQCPVYTGENALADLDSQGQEDLLTALGFHVKSVSLYQSAEGPVYREGSDTLRIQKDGTLLYRGAESGQTRYQALSTREKDLRLEAESLLDKVMEGRMDQGTLVCQSSETLSDGTTQLTFCYLLSGTQVYLSEEGWGARFVFRGSQVEEFEILVRRYTLTGEQCAVPPQPQAIAALSALDQGGKELRLYYQDRDDGTAVTAGWAVGIQGRRGRHGA